MTRTRFGSVALALPLLLGSTLLAGCGDEPEPAASPSPSASQDPTPTEPTPSQSPDEGPESRLLDADALPGLNDEWQWSETATGTITTNSFGQCAEFDLLSIGATEGVSRTYAEADVAEPSATAAMQVVEFPDARTASSAAAVLDSWQASCHERIRPRLSPRVSDIEPVQVSSGTGSWYLVITSRPKAAEGHFHAFGMVVNDSRMALLTMDNDGQDRNYEAGQDPMQLAVAAAAELLD